MMRFQALHSCGPDLLEPCDVSSRMAHSLCWRGSDRGMALGVHVASARCQCVAIDASFMEVKATPVPVE
jgi:hypothetical protein